MSTRLRPDELAEVSQWVRDLLRPQFEDTYDVFRGVTTLQVACYYEMKTCSFSPRNFRSLIHVSVFILFHILQKSAKGHCYFYPSLDAKKLGRWEGGRKNLLFVFLPFKFQSQG